MLGRRDSAFLPHARLPGLCRRSRGGECSVTLEVRVGRQEFLRVQSLPLVTTGMGSLRWEAGSRGVFGRSQSAIHLEVLL